VPGDLAERMLTHFVGGLWRAPLSERMLTLPCGGRIVCADGRDVARAVTLAPTGAAVLIWNTAVPEAAVRAQVDHWIGKAGGCILLPAPEFSRAALGLGGPVIAALPLRHRFSLMFGDAASQTALAATPGILPIVWSGHMQS
jgi:hypothetical protein